MSTTSVQKTVNDIKRAQAKARVIRFNLNTRGETAISIRTGIDRQAMRMIDRETPLEVLKIYSDDLIVRVRPAAESAS